MTTPVLPPAIKYGRVTGRFLMAVIDGVDADANPDARAVTGTVTFTPRAKHLLVQTGGTKAQVFLAPRVATIDSAGLVRDEQGREGIVLVATDSPDVQPDIWTWQAVFDLDEGAKRDPYDLHVPSDGTVDLADVVPVPASDGNYVARGPAGPPGAAGIDWDEITNKPTFAPTATSASYNALTDRPVGLVSRVLYANGGYNTRPSSAPAGFAEFVGPSQPTGWLIGDTWINSGTGALAVRTS